VETLRRNFVRCPVDPKFYIYADNEKDSYTQKSAAAAKPQGQLSKRNQNTIFRDYQENLKGSPDGLSDVESNYRSNQPDQPSDFKEEYESCRNLLFEVTAVIRDGAGAVVASKPVSALSQVFEMALGHPSLVKDLIKKAQH